MNTITIKKIFAGYYFAYSGDKPVASIKCEKSRYWVMINRLGHVRILATLSACKHLLAEDVNY